MNQHVCAYLGAVIMAIKSPIHPWAAAAAEVSIAAVLRGEIEREREGRCERSRRRGNRARRNRGVKMVKMSDGCLAGNRRLISGALP